MRITYRSVIRSSILTLGLVFNLIDNTRSTREALKFEKQETVSEIKMWTRDDITVMHLQEPEKRHKICLYAKMEVNLPYIAYNVDRSWRDWERGHLSNGYALNCKTLPSMYLLRTVGSRELTIAYIQSSVNEYQFDKEILKVDFANPRDQDQSWFNRGKSLMDLNDEDRMNLCDAARKHISVPLYFLDHNVPKAQPYEFKYSNEKLKAAYAISCPTLPRLFLRDTEKKLELVLLSSFIDDYEFELEYASPFIVDPLTANEKASSESALLQSSLTQLEPLDRKNLCNIARRYFSVWLSPFVEDTDVPEARLYSFQYSPHEQKLVNVALLCPKLPSMYLRQDDSNQGTKIKITFAPNPAARYTYTVELIWHIKELEDAEKSYEKKELAEHSFASLDKDECWHLCFAAQKHLLSDPNRWTFMFTENERIFAEHWLLLIPEYVRLPELKRIRYDGHNPDTIDWVIHCSTWPRVYLHLGESSNVVKIMLYMSDLNL